MQFDSVWTVYKFIIGKKFKRGKREREKKKSVTSAPALAASSIDFRSSFFSQGLDIIFPRAFVVASRRIMDAFDVRAMHIARKIDQFRLSSLVHRSGESVKRTLRSFSSPSDPLSTLIGRCKGVRKKNRARDSRKYRQAFSDTFPQLFHRQIKSCNEYAMMRWPLRQCNT